jgi:hypothetical protein
MQPVLLMAVLGSGSAVASGPEDWAALHSGRLMAALDRDATAAISVYEAVIEHLDPDDPLRADYLYWLGRAWFEAGESDKAAEVLAGIDGRSSVSPAARALRGRIHLDQNRILALPERVEPDEDGAPVVVGWGQALAPLQVIPAVGGGPTTLSWPLATEEVRAGFLALGLHPDAGQFEGIRFAAQSSEVVLAARVVVETFDGHTYAGIPSVLRPGVWTDVEARASQLRSRSPGEAGLDPRDVSMVAIELAPVDPGAVSASATVLVRSIVLDGER